GLRVTLRKGHPPLTREALLGVATLLVADQRDGAAVEPAQPGDEGAVVGAAPIAMQFDPVVEDPRHVVERVRPLLVPRELDRPPDLVLGRGLLDLELLQLLAEPLLLAGDARPAEERQARKLPQPLAQPELGVTGQRASAVVPGTGAARVAGRRRRGG